MPFPFENLDVYKRTLVFIEQIDLVCRQKKGEIGYSFEDQLRRAALSIALNIAEGNGRWHTKDKQQFFWIARGSVFEVVPLLQLLRRRDLLSEQAFGGLYTDLEVIGKMLTNLIKSVENLIRQKPSP